MTGHASLTTLALTVTESIVVIPSTGMASVPDLVRPDRFFLTSAVQGNEKTTYIEQPDIQKEPDVNRIDLKQLIVYKLPNATQLQGV